MDIRTLLTETKSFPAKRKSASLSPSPSFQTKSQSRSASISSPVSAISPSSNQSISPYPTMKRVKFTLTDVDFESPSSLELNISPFDPPIAITSTVKDFFALYDTGVSFTDSDGSILIITPDNLLHNMEVYVNRVPSAESAQRNKKKRKSVLSSRKRSRRLSLEKDIQEVDIEEDDVQKSEESERKEKTLSAEVSIDNILDSSRRRLAKFSSEVHHIVPGD